MWSFLIANTATTLTTGSRAVARHQPDRLTLSSTQPGTSRGCSSQTSESQKKWSSNLGQKYSESVLHKSQQVIQNKAGKNGKKYHVFKKARVTSNQITHNIWHCLPAHSLMTFHMVKFIISLLAPTTYFSLVKNLNHFNLMVFKSYHILTEIRHD